MLLVTNENGGPLGLTAIPDTEIGGLLVQSVEVGSRAEKGKLRKGDRILEINGTKLIGLSEASIQDQLRRWLSASELRLRVIRAHSIDNTHNHHHNKASSDSTDNQNKVAHVSPTRKVPGSMATNTLQAANTRKLGKKIEITLRKGANGLGFSVTTRDNPAGGHCPIYIKNILPKGAAVEDGRLKPGDRLLEVDNVPMTGKSQTDVVYFLRSLPTGTAVKILVSRQKEIPEVEEREIGTESTQPKQPPPPILPMKNVIKSPSAPNILDVVSSRDEADETIDSVKMRIKKLNSSSSSSSVNESNIIPWRNREILELCIPVHDTEKAGLGVSVKGKTGQITPNSSFSSNNMKHDGDLGIFVRSVLHGGAASRDGRLKMNDQLLAVNGISLLGQSNADAMDTLKRALQTNGNKPGIFVVKVARRASASRPGSTIITENNDVNVGDTSATNSSEQSGSTVIQLSPNKDDSKSSHQSPSASDSNIRWSNPILDRLTGGSGVGGKPTMLMQALPNGLRNESYYMATKENWSPMANFNNSNVVLIEEDSETNSQTENIRPELQHQVSSTPTDVTYASQLSLENTLHDPFSRDAIGRRSISEKHHAALDAKETGTYQRSKKMREERDKRNDLDSVEMLTNVNHRKGSMKTARAKSELRAEALDQVGELGPSLGLKKSSSLESLQTMVQELQMADEPRSPGALRAPRGRGREDALRAAVERPEARKHWLLEDGSGDDGGFTNRGTLQASSSSQGKNKNQKKSGLLKGIGHMFRFGKHRKPDIQADTSESYSTWSSDSIGQATKSSTMGPSSSKAMLQHQHMKRETSHERQLSAPSLPPSYNHPPTSNKNSPMTGHAPSTKISLQDAFNHRYSHYANYDEVQGQIR
jgi:partitioning defective protein 3